MSIVILKDQVQQFLKSKTPEVMAIKGAWGIGKTYSWKKLLQDAKDEKRIALNKYAYVSLFGVNSIESLKTGIFTGMMSEKAGLKVGNTINTVLEGIKDVPILKKFGGGLIEPLIISNTLSEALICIDDFERKGDKLTVKDVFGLISYLKEEKNCKVVVILNEEFLKESMKDEYETFLEKAIDFEVVFEPTAKECADIALEDNDISVYLKGFIETLEINNIRIIRKIDRLTKKLVPMLKKIDKLDNKVIHNALHSLTLFTWCRYKGKGAPNYDFIKNIAYNLLMPLDDQKNKENEEKEWEATLRKYDFLYVDEFDSQILKMVENGYIEETSFLKEAKKLNDQYIADASKASFGDAWRVFHGSFNDNKEEVVNTLYDSLKKHIKYIHIINIDSTITLFRNLGESEKADEIIDLYVGLAQNNIEILNLNDSLWRGNLKDETLMKKFAAKYEVVKKESRKTLKEILEKISIRDGWNEEDEEILASVNSDELYRLFKEERAYVDKYLQFGNFANATERQKTIISNAKEALKRISQESQLNAERVKLYNID